MQKWTIKNTFLELDEGPSDYSDSYGLRRSKSDGALSTASTSSSQPIAAESRPTFSACMQFLPKDSKQTLFSSSSECTGASEDKMENDSFQEDDVTDATKPGTSSEGETQIDGFEEDDVVDATKPIIYSEDFPLDEAMQVYQKISDLVEKGTDLRDVLSTDMAGVDLTRYVPVDPSTGKPTSLGSVRHLVGSCAPCKFLSKRQCRKGETCLHCHFEHEAPPQKRSHRKYEHYKYRLRLQAKAAKSVNQQIAGQDGHAIIDGKRTSCQTKKDQPVPAGTRISL